MKRLNPGTRIVLKSHFGYEITKIDIYDDQFLVAHTPETLLMGDLESCKLSEVPWNGSGKEKFYFDNPQVTRLFRVIWSEFGGKWIGSREPITAPPINSGKSKNVGRGKSKKRFFPSC